VKDVNVRPLDARELNPQSYIGHRAEAVTQETSYRITKDIFPYPHCCFIGPPVRLYIDPSFKSLRKQFIENIRYLKNELAGHILSKIIHFCAATLRREKHDKNEYDGEEGDKIVKYTRLHFHFYIKKEYNEQDDKREPR
jgi:hypothetical protein